MERLQIGIIADGGRTGQTDFTDQLLRNSIYNRPICADISDNGQVFHRLNIETTLQSSRDKHPPE